MSRIVGQGTENLSRVHEEEEEDPCALDQRGEDDLVIVGLIVKITEDPNGTFSVHGNDYDDLNETPSEGKIREPLPNRVDADDDDDDDNDFKETFSNGDDDDGDDISETLSDGEIKESLFKQDYDDLNETLSKRDDDDADGSTFKNVRIKENHNDIIQGRDADDYTRRDDDDDDLNETLLKSDDDESDKTTCKNVRIKEEHNETFQGRDADEYKGKIIENQQGKKFKQKMMQKAKGGEKTVTEEQSSNNQEKKDETFDCKEGLNEMLQNTDNEAVHEKQEKQVKGQQGWKSKDNLTRTNQLGEKEQEKNQTKNNRMQLRSSVPKQKQVLNGDLKEENKKRTDDKPYEVWTEEQERDNVETHDGSVWVSRSEEEEIEKKPQRRRRKKKVKEGIAGKEVFQKKKNSEKKDERKHRGNRRRTNAQVQCTICGVLVHRYYLSIHMNLHTGNTKHMCEICGQTYIHLNSLKSHTRVRHSLREKFPCSVCGKQYATQRYTRYHEATAHSDVFPNADMTGLNITVGPWKPKEKRFRCSYPECNRQFIYKKFREDHEASAHKGEFVKSLGCTICGKTFSNSGNMHRHMITHRVNPRPYVCKFCPAAFTQTTSRKAHERNHTGERPYLCKFCQKGFTQQSNQKTHEKRCKMNRESQVATAKLRAKT